VYAVEGIGHDFMVDTLDMSVIDEVIEVSDRDSFIAARRLAREEGIFCGGSTGTALWGALQVARRLGPGKVVVCILADAGARYVSKCFNDEWMKDKGFFDAEDRLGLVRDVLHFKGGHVEFAGAAETIATVSARMNELGISQMPLRERRNGGFRMVHESDLLHSLVNGQARPSDTIERVAAKLEGQVALADSVVKVQRILDSENVAVVVDQESIVGIVSKIDVVRFLAARAHAPRGPAG
jgi:cystathionine beta-synthase